MNTPRKPMSEQLDFEFSDPSESRPPANALDTWREERRRRIESLAHKQGLPIGHCVRVDFENGPPLEGLLSLNEELLFTSEKARPDLHLRIGSSDFHANEIRSCIRMD